MPAKDYLYIELVYSMIKSIIQSDLAAGLGMPIIQTSDGQISISPAKLLLPPMDAKACKTKEQRGIAAVQVVKAWLCCSIGEQLKLGVGKKQMDMVGLMSLGTEYD